MLGGAVSLVADAATDPVFLSAKREGDGSAKGNAGENAKNAENAETAENAAPTESMAGDAETLVVMIFAFTCSGAAAWLSFLKS